MAAAGPPCSVLGPPNRGCLADRRTRLSGHLSVTYSTARHHAAWTPHRASLQPATVPHPHPCHPRPTPLPPGRPYTLPCQSPHPADRFKTLPPTHPPRWPAISLHSALANFLPVRHHMASRDRRLPCGDNRADNEIRWPAAADAGGVFVPLRGQWSGHWDGGVVPIAAYSWCSDWAPV